MKIEVGHIVEVYGFGLKKPVKYRVTSIFGFRKTGLSFTMQALKRISYKRNTVTIKQIK